MIRPKLNFEEPRVCLLTFIRRTIQRYRLHGSQYMVMMIALFLCSDAKVIIRILGILAQAARNVAQTRPS